MPLKSKALVGQRGKREDKRLVRMNGKQVREIRTRQFGWTIEQAAAKAGIDSRIWTKVERNGPVQVRTAHAIANCLKGKYDDFLPVIEVRSYHVGLKVMPLTSRSDSERKVGLLVDHGYGIPPPKSQLIKSDNIAYVRKTVTFSEQIGRTDQPFELSYRTRNGGLISIRNNKDVSDEKLNEFLIPELHSPRERRYDDTGDDVMFLVTPEAGKTRMLDLKVYKGYDNGHRNLTCYLSANTNYERPVELRLNLTKYQSDGYGLSKEPKLVFFPQDPDHEAQYTSPEKYALECPGITPKHSTDVWKWKWTVLVPGTQGGVLYLYWDFA